MNFSPQQDDALTRVQRWIDNPSGQQVFRLFGYAGTGKTTLAKHLASHVEGTVLFMSYTGKAAHVLQRKGCPNATTIHKNLYIPTEKSANRLKQMQADLDALTAKLLGDGVDPAKNWDVQDLTYRIERERKALKTPSWSLNMDGPINGASLLVIDEVSMVGERIGRDLESFGVPILVLGDPAQLPPVADGGYFINGKPDVLLTEIHRQALDNPVLYLATRVRSGGTLQYGKYGESSVVNKPDRDAVLAADQVLVGRNKTRTAYNARMRELLGHQSPLPCKKDKLVCLRNNHEEGLLNGSMWTVDDVYYEVPDPPLGLKNVAGIDLVLRPDTDAPAVAAEAHAEYFFGDEPPYYEIKDRNCFDYGYALTTHKAQGSEWPNVYVFDESWCFRQDSAKWLYTALTRASEKVTVVVQ